MKHIEDVIIVGAGIMGANIAKLCLENGKNTHLVDISASTLERTKQSILVGKSTTSTLSCHQEVPLCSQRVFVIEAVPENMVLKQQLLTTIESRVTDDSIIMTNTSSLSIDDLAHNLRLPNRFAGVHFFNPADIVPGVEVILHPAVSTSVVDKIKQLLTELHKIPAQINRSVPGFVVNRVQHALMRECFYLIEQGIIEPGELDKLIKSTLGIRLAVNGPCVQRDFNGLDTHLSIAEHIYPSLCQLESPPEMLKALVTQGKLGIKSSQGFYAWSDETSRKAKSEEAIKIQQLNTVLY
ncbi:3-hydroxybutyryl-CoA dehydrogenase [Vibrio ishigakensis]|uniref:3-hydroxybutyryl-CoA dehydrogenase n=1 Tax=Vibrio ishigakensis TaxID=1481914 RepID=A0A0B8PJ96_9VIBR|nr:3-hydroxybutyryl-CoA dehydrogenase [Vibrio ishigakensis]